MAINKNDITLSSLIKKNIVTSKLNHGKESSRTGRLGIRTQCENMVGSDLVKPHTYLKASAFTTIDVSNTDNEVTNHFEPNFGRVMTEVPHDDPNQNPNPQINETYETQNMTTYNDISDLEEHSGLKKLERHLGRPVDINPNHQHQNIKQELNMESGKDISDEQTDNRPHPTIVNTESDVVQLVTEVSHYDEDEKVIDNIKPAPRMANTSIRSRMLEEEKSPK